MATENEDSFKIVTNPFNPTQEVAIVKELVPDLSFVHVWAADKLGNAIVFPPYIENLWGCFASKTVVVTTEKILKTDMIRKLANTHQCLTLPGGIVDFVIESPFGGHPGSHYGPRGSGYDIDLDHLVEFRKSAKSVQKLSSWIKEWIHNTNPESYLLKVALLGNRY